MIRPLPNRTLCPLALCAALLASGCATHERWIERRPPDRSLITQWAWGKDPSPISPVTLAAAESHGLDAADRDERAQLISRLEQQALSRPTPDVDYSLGELASIEAERLAKSSPQEALGFYAESLIHGYGALAADPQRRVPGSTTAYGRSLTGLLRLLREQGRVRPGETVPLPLTHGTCSIAVELHSKRWKVADFQDFEFASDYQVVGLRNHYYSSGVGVPLIGIRYHEDRDHPEDKHYPKKLCYPLTATARAERYPPNELAPTGGVRLVLELHDTTDHESFELAGRRVPLETDLSTPLAYYLDQPELHEEELSTIGLLQPGRVKQLQGLYLLEPYDPDRIPVIMVHGVWSSPATWMEMFNDLRADPRIRSRYQFWFYLYPTGNPFWVSAANLRTDLIELRQTFDPNHQSRALDQAVLVGHSMGGLLSRLQTVDSGDDFWRIVSERSISELDAEPETRDYINNLFYFRPNPSVQRVVTIGTPYRGSRFANGLTQWLGTKLIAFPMQHLAQRQELFRRNPDLFRPNVAARVLTSIDSLNPESPMLSTLLAARSGPWVRYHNIVGDEPRSRLTSWYASRGDGIVSLESARLDDQPQLASQIVVPEGHVLVHRHPQAIAEVRRVLMEHLAALEPRGLASQAIPPTKPWPAGAGTSRVVLSAHTE